jgi:4-hydroxy-tetrahydrodipicolinate synthase
MPQFQNPSGIFTAIVTPFGAQGEIDLKAYEKLLDFQIENKVQGIVVCGTTGESPTLTKEEKKSLITFTVKKLKNTGVLTYAGTGSNDTIETVEFSRWASESAQVDGLLVVTPYYNKPSQKGLIAHFSKVADAVNCPVMLYNVPGRTSVSLTPETIAALSKHKHIRACKEATGNLTFASETFHHVLKTKTQFNLLSGDDMTFLPFLSVGGVGCVSVASNVFPKEMGQIWNFYNSGKIKEAQLLHDKLFLIFRDLFVEANPMPVKYALQLLGMCSEKTRLPLCELSEASKEKVKVALIAAGAKL